MAESLFIMLRSDEYEGTSLKAIHDQMTDYTLYEDFRGSFDYFSLWREDNESYFGKNDPERLQEDVQEWNKRIDKSLYSLEQEIRTEMKKQGVKSLTEYKPQDNNRHLLWKFRQALCSMTDHFTYGQNYLYRSDDYGWCTRLPDDVIEDAMTHPEDYIMIQCFYH